MIIHGDCLEEMRKMEPNSISAIVTDPPYGLHFMGKGWDYDIPGVEYWRECLRITKPGGYVLCMGGTRTFHRLTCSAEDSGWEIRDCIMWIYGSGFPKSHNHFGIEGFGTALKPAYEPIIMAMKPCEGTFKQNAEKWGQAGINIDGCRVESNEDLTRECLGHASSSHEGYKRPYHETAEKKVYGSKKGRWPANVIFDEEAAQMLDEQSGNLKSGSPGSRKKEWSGYQTGLKKLDKESGFGDSGGASRFFYCAKASSGERNEGLGEMESKPSYMVENGSKTSGTNGVRYDRNTLHQNNHPTVKPIKLMEYLIKLVMPPKDGILLDPFAGSGTTILAARKLGYTAIGIEKEQQYCEIARERIKNVSI